MSKKSQKTVAPALAENKVSKKTPVTFSYTLPMIFIGVLAFLLYANTLKHDYAYDDYSVVVGNKTVLKGISAIPEIFSTAYWHGMTGQNDAVYRPMSLSSFAIENEISAQNASLGHLINVLLFTLSAILLLYFLFNLLPTVNPAIPFAIALLWTCHPLHTEVVANIKSRDEILSFFFCIMAMYFFVLGKERNLSWIAGFICFFLGLLSKENALTFAAIIPLTVYWFNYSKMRLLFSVIGVAIAAAIYMGLRMVILETDVTDAHIALIDNSLVGAPDIVTRLASAVNILGLYIFKFFVPWNLSSDYSFNQVPLTSITGLGFILTFIILGFAVYYVIKQFRHRNVIAYGILFFLLSISIVSNILFLIGSHMADRFMYTPSLGLCIVLVFLLVKIFNLTAGKGSYSMLAFAGKNVLPALILGIFVMGFSYKTINRNKAWQNNLTLFTEDVKTSPESARTNLYFGIEVFNISRNESLDATTRKTARDKAVGLFQQAAAIDSTWYLPHFELAYAASMDNNQALALQEYRKAYSLQPNDFNVLNNLGNTYYRQDNADSAISFLQKALTQRIDNQFTLESIIKMLYDNKRYKEVRPYVTELNKYFPESNTAKEYGPKLDSLGFRK
ncbi:MAG: hypothetical protein ABIT96_06760 [Ferruginibacter sp.]